MPPGASTTEPILVLADRGVVGVSGPDTVKLLQGLVTNDLGALRPGHAVFAGLLSPQGKILFEFFVVATESGVLLDVARDRAGELVKRVAMYKLRANVTISDRSAEYDVMAVLGPGEWAAPQVPGLIAFPDPRHSDLGTRIIAPKALADRLLPGDERQAQSRGAYDARRIHLGVPEGGKDYDFADAYPHEADFDRFNGVSFTKGCFVGQEVVARMQHKTVVRKRIVKIEGAAPLAAGSTITIGDAAIGRIGSVDATSALAMLRLDRAIEASDKGIALQSDSIAVTPDPRALELYRSQAQADASGTGQGR